MKIFQDPIAGHGWNGGRGMKPKGQKKRGKEPKMAKPFDTAARGTNTRGKGVSQSALNARTRNRKPFVNPFGGGPPQTQSLKGGSTEVGKGGNGGTGHWKRNTNI